MQPFAGVVGELPKQLVGRPEMRHRKVAHPCSSGACFSRVHCQVASEQTVIAWLTLESKYQGFLGAGTASERKTPRMATWAARRKSSANGAQSARRSTPKPRRNRCEEVCPAAIAVVEKSEGADVPGQHRPPNSGIQRSRASRKGVPSAIGLDCR